MSPIPGQPWFGNLDALRTFACFSVVLQHSAIWIFNNDSVPHVIRRVSLFIGDGHLGVHFFYVLSGFLITYLLLREQYNQGKVQLWRFYMRRILRIWPLYFITILVGFLVYPALLTALWQEPGFVNVSWKYIAFIGNFDVIHWHELGMDRYVNRVLSNSWSISVEEQFYLIWPLLLIFFRRFWFPILCAVCIIFSAGWSIYNAEYVGVYFHSAGCLFYLSTGSLLAWLSQNSNRFKLSIEEMSHKRSASIYTIVILILIFRDDISMESDWHELTNILAGLFFAFVIADQSFSKRPLFAAGRFKLATRIGKYTYSWYLLHIVVIMFANNIFHYLNWFRGGIINELPKALIVIPGSLLLAMLSYHLLERPFLKLKSRFKPTGQ